MGHALHRPIWAAPTRRGADTAAKPVRTQEAAPTPQQLFFEAGIALVAPLMLSAVIDVWLQAASVGH